MDLLERTPPGTNPANWRAATSERLLKRAKATAEVEEATERVVEARTELREAKAIGIRRKMDLDEAETAYHRALAEVDLGERDGADEEFASYAAAQKALEAARRDEAKVRHKLDLLRDREKEAIDRATNGYLTDVRNRAKELISACVAANRQFDESTLAYRAFVADVRGIGIVLPDTVPGSTYVHAAGPAGQTHRTYAATWSAQRIEEGWTNA